MKTLVCILVCFLLSSAWCEAQTTGRSPQSIRAEHGAELAARGKPAFSYQELGAPVCGNSVLDGGEQCDDGNAVSGDGCSDSCQIENGYECTDPIPSDMTNLLLDPGFEAGTSGGGIWDESSTHFDTLICDATRCGLAGQHDGDFWVWFGGVDDATEEGAVSQSVTIPGTASELRFWFAASACASADDFVEVLIDDQQIWLFRGDNPSCNNATYVQQVVDISTWADDAEHKIEFHSITSTLVDEFTDFFLDDVLLQQSSVAPIPSMCTVKELELIFGDGFESS